MCRKGIGRSIDLSKNCRCVEGYYEDGNSHNCFKCKIPLCKKCDSYGDCLECNNNKLDPKHHCLNK